jgi:ATP-dependent DNA ligase
MTMTTPLISDIIKSLRAVGSTNTKRYIIEQNSNNEALRLLFYAAYDGSVNFWIKADKDTKTNGTGVITAELIQDILAVLNGRALTGNAARDYLTALLQRLTQPEADVIICMINRDLDCKTSTSIANGVWKNLIREFPVMLAEKFNEKNAKIFYAAERAKKKMIVQTKKDGGRAEATIQSDGSVRVCSRNGNELTAFDHFQYLSAFAGHMVDGELVAYNPDGTPMDRKTSNGIYTKMVRGTATEDEVASMRFIVWDMVPLADFYSGVYSCAYSDRFMMLSNIASLMDQSLINVVESEEIWTVAEAVIFYNKMLARKEEGAMLKLADAPWEDGRSKNVLKLKEIKDATLYCYAVKGHSKKPGWIGSLECRTSCGELEVSIGSGLSEDDRKRPVSDFVGSLIDMQYNQIIKSKGSDRWSMFLPIYKGIRVDVDEADDFEKLK